MVIEIWARLKLIHPEKYNEIAIDNIPLFDRLEHMILAFLTLLKNVQHDGSGATLSPELHQLMKEKYDELFPIERVKHNHNTKILEWYESLDL